VATAERLGRRQTRGGVISGGRAGAAVGQRGEQPDDFKPMPSVGKGIEEIRVKDESGA
jgi:hypothetical protein